VIEGGEIPLIVGTVASPRDVRPASSTARDVDDVTAAWVTANSGLHHPALTALPSALCWRLDERH